MIINLSFLHLCETKKNLLPQNTAGKSNTASGLEFFSISWQVVGLCCLLLSASFLYIFIYKKEQQQTRSYWSHIHCCSFMQKNRLLFHNKHGKQSLHLKKGTTTPCIILHLHTFWLYSYILHRAKAFADKHLSFACDCIVFKFRIWETTVLTLL